MPSNIAYEWCAETVTTRDTPEHEAGEVIDHYHATTPDRVLDFMRRWPLPDGQRYALALVRTGVGGGRSWAYVTTDNRLPDHFIDALGRRTQPVRASDRTAYDRARAALATR